MEAEVPASPSGGRDEGGDQSPRSNVREQDRYLPLANISRIMKKMLPRNGKTTKGAKDAMRECVSEFISFITSQASETCQKEKRKTINGDDVLRAMITLGFDDYIDPLRLYLQKYREIEGDGKGSTKGAESSLKRDAGGLQGGNLSGSSMQWDMKGDVRFLWGAESSGKTAAGVLQGGNLAGSSMQWDMKGDGKGSAKGAESSLKRDAGGLQGGNLSGSSMQGDMKILQQGSFTEDMTYMNTQYHNGNLSS